MIATEFIINYKKVIVKNKSPIAIIEIKKVRLKSDLSATFLRIKSMTNQTGITIFKTIAVIMKPLATFSIKIGLT